MKYRNYLNIIKKNYKHSFKFVVQPLVYFSDYFINLRLIIMVQLCFILSEMKGKVSQIYFPNTITS
jgi:hypothetical protein